MNKNGSLRTWLVTYYLRHIYHIFSDRTSFWLTGVVDSMGCLGRVAGRIDRHRVRSGWRLLPPPDDNPKEESVELAFRCTSKLGLGFGYSICYRQSSYGKEGVP